MNKFQGLLRYSIASAGNDHRLGANEAPPAILSIFLGDMLTDIFGQIEKGDAKTTKSGGLLDTGVSVLPKLPRDAGDRNRTSPFAFTGNKFEFRAVSANQSIAFPNIALNVAVTEALDYVATELEKGLKEGKKLPAAVKALLTKMMKDNKRIIFNGNNYADEWQKDAAKRGLLNLTHVGRRLPRADEARRGEGVREVRRAERARAARALRRRARAVQQDHQHRSAADGADGQPLHPAGRRTDTRGSSRTTVSAVKAAGATAKETTRGRSTSSAG